MKISNKKCFIVICCFILCLFTACKAEEENSKVEITLMHGWGGTLKTHKTMQEIYADFSKENPDIDLKCIPYSDSSIAVEKANDMLAVGKMPDIISTNGLSYFVINAVKRGKALNLMPFIEQDKALRKEIHPSVLETWTTLENSIYTLPDALEVAGYWYNKEYFKQAGLVDELGEAAIPTTWQEFLQTAEKLDKWVESEGRDISVFTLDETQIIEFFSLARIAGAGREGFQMSMSSPSSFDNEIIKELVRDVNTLYQYSENVDNIENARQNFYDGESIIYFNGVWESDILSGSKIANQMKYANYPTDTGRSLSYVSPSSGYVVSKNEDKKKIEACIRFLKYILSEGVQAKLALETGQAPSNPNFSQKELLKEESLLGNAVNTAYKADIKIKTINSVWSGEAVNELRKYIYKNIETERIEEKHEEKEY